MTQESLGREHPFAATDSSPVAARWVAEAERLHHRYQTEIVEALGLCPWAVRARTDGTVRARVMLQSDANVESTLDALDTLTLDAQAEVAFLIYPRITMGRGEFERFVTNVRETDVPRHPLGCVPFVFAAFHPDAIPDATSGERLIPFLRRTPDPTIQILRSSVLEGIQSGTPQGTQFIDSGVFNFDAPPQATVSLRERIAGANLATVDRIGVDELTRRLDAIAEDRARTYRALAGAMDPVQAREPR